MSKKIPWVGEEIEFSVAGVALTYILFICAALADFMYIQITFLFIYMVNIWISSDMHRPELSCVEKIQAFVKQTFIALIFISPLVLFFFLRWIMGLQMF